jgi:hypothetical protein
MEIVQARSVQLRGFSSKQGADNIRCFCLVIHQASFVAAVPAMGTVLVIG